MSAYSFGGQTGDDLLVIFARLVEQFPPLASIRDAALALQAQRVIYDSDAEEIDGQAMIEAGRDLLTAMQPLMDCVPEVLPN